MTLEPQEYPYSRVRPNSFLPDRPNLAGYQSDVVPPNREFLKKVLDADNLQRLMAKSTRPTRWTPGKPHTADYFYDRATPSLPTGEEKA